MDDPPPSTTTNGDAIDANANVDGGSVLPNLPSDVFATLTSTFDLAAISNLRRVSHSLNAAATNELFTKCFAHGITDLSTKSLNELVALCSSEFGPHVRNITIRASYWRLDELEKQLKERKKWCSEASNGPIFCSTQRDLTEEELLAAEQNYAAFKDLRTDQAALQANGKVASLLAKAFQALGKRSISIKLEAAQYRESLSARMPAKRLYGGPADEMQSIMNDAFRATVTALFHSRIGVKILDVFDVEHAGHVSLDGLYDSFTSLTEQATIGAGLNSASIPAGLRDLRSLSLNVSPSAYIETRAADYNDYSDYGEHKPRAEPFVHEAHLTTLRALLAACSTTLTNLDICFRGLDVKHHGDSIAFFSRLPAMPNLKTLHVRSAVISESDMIDLLKPCTQLTTLGFHHLSLSAPPDGSKDTRAWLPIFCQLATIPTLQTFEVNAIYMNNFQTQIFPSSPASALARIPKEHYTTRIYFEGCPCVTFTGDEILTRNPKPDGSVFEPRNDIVDDSRSAVPMGSGGVRWGAPTMIEEDGPLDVEEVGIGLSHCVTSEWQMQNRTQQVEAAEERMWTPIRYKIGKRRPLGSPSLYRWTQVRQWEYGLF